MGRWAGMTDEELAGELERRADSVDLEPDWPRISLLPAVRSGMAEPPPRRAWRLAPLAGLASIVAVALVVVIALPTLAPGRPAATPSSSPPASYSPTDDPGPILSAAPGQAVPCVVRLPPPGVPLSLPTVIDRTALAKYCTEAPVQFAATAIEVSNPPTTGIEPDTSVLEVRWQGTPCIVDESVTLFERDGAYRLLVTLPADCDSAVVPRTIWLHLGRPLPAESVAAQVVRASPVGTVTQAEFTLTLAAGRPTYVAGELITDIEAVLSFTGPEPTVEVAGVESPVQAFETRQLDGPLSPGAGWNEPCVRHTLIRDRPLIVPYQKSGGFSDDDPYADFMRAFFADPELRLPAGTWEIKAYAHFDVGGVDCRGRPIRLEASIVIRVAPILLAEPTDNPAPSVSPLPTAPPPTSTLDPTLSPTPSPEAQVQVIDCTVENAGAGWPAPPIVIDRTGLVQGCSHAEGTAGADGGVGVLNPAGPGSEPDLTVLQLQWSGTYCDVENASFTLQRSGDAYRLLVALHDPGPCFLVPVEHAFQLHLSEPIPAELVEAGIAYPRSIDKQGDFTLTLRSAIRHYPAGDPIRDIVADLSYGGPEPQVDVIGSQVIIYGFALEQLDGDIRVDPAYPIECVVHTLGPGSPVRQPYRKSGLLDDDGPLADFYREFLSDPLLRLPPGTWRITAYAGFELAPDCGGDEPIELEASIIITTTP